MLLIVNDPCDRLSFFVFFSDVGKFDDRMSYFRPAVAQAQVFLERILK